MADITGADLARRVGEQLETASPDLHGAVSYTMITDAAGPGQQLQALPIER